MESVQGGSPLRQNANISKGPSSASKRDNGQPKGTCARVMAPVAEQRGRSRCRCVSCDAGIRRVLLLSRPYVVGLRCIGMALFLLLAQHCIVKCAVAAPHPVSAITSAHLEAGIALTSPVTRRLDGRGGDDDTIKESDLRGYEDRDAEAVPLVVEPRPLPTQRLQRLQQFSQGLMLGVESLMATVLLAGFLFVVGNRNVNCSDSSTSLLANRTGSLAANTTVSPMANTTGSPTANSTSSHLAGSCRVSDELFRNGAAGYYGGVVLLYMLLLLVRLVFYSLRRPSSTRDLSEV